MGRAARLLVLALLLIVFVMFVLPLLLPRPARRRWNRFFYENGRPTEFGRRANLVFAWVAAHGLTPKTWPVEPRGGTIALVVAGRKSGQARRNVVTWVEHDGDKYLVSMLGNDADWVRNVRAARGDASMSHGRSRSVRLVEVPPEGRAEILQKYLKLTATSTRDHLGVEPDDPLEEFERIAPQHPVFRIVELDESGDVAPRPP